MSLPMPPPADVADPLSAQAKPPPAQVDPPPAVGGEPPPAVGGEPLPERSAEPLPEGGAEPPPVVVGEPQPGDYPFIREVSDNSDDFRTCVTYGCLSCSRVEQKSDGIMPYGFYVIRGTVYCRNCDRDSIFPMIDSIFDSMSLKKFKIFINDMSEEWRKYTYANLAESGYFEEIEEHQMMLAQMHGYS